MKAIAKNIGMKPRKANLVAACIRGKDVTSATNILKGINSKPAKLIYKTLVSAIANAENNDGKRREQLKIIGIQVGKGTHLKRSRSANKGQRHPQRKYRTNLLVELEVMVQERNENTNTE